MQGGAGQISGGSRCLVHCERDCAACTAVTRAISVGAPLIKRPSSRKASRKIQCAINMRKMVANGPKARKWREGSFRRRRVRDKSGSAQLGESAAQLSDDKR